MRVGTMFQIPDDERRLRDTVDKQLNGRACDIDPQMDPLIGHDVGIRLILTGSFTAPALKIVVGI
jgi:hypothetical protein